MKLAGQEETVSEQQRSKRRRRKAAGRKEPSPAIDASARQAAGGGENGNETALTQLESTSTAASATQMLQLAVGRSPVRARRPTSAVQKQPGRLTDASLAAFDLSPDLDDTATATTVQPADFLKAADFSLPRFDLQT